MNLTITDAADKCECEAELARLQAMQATWHRAIETVKASDRSDEDKARAVDAIDDEIYALTDEITDCVTMLDNYEQDRGGVSTAAADRAWYHGKVL